jgi:drug/metabolite transporter (DMT)-like permease
MLSAISAVAFAVSSAKKALWSNGRPDKEDLAPAGSGVEAVPWWSMPHTMAAKNWRSVVVGTFFVTFLGPALFLRSLLLMPFGIASTLNCVAPLYEPALARVFSGTRPNPAAVGGSLLAFCGVAVLCL